MKDEKSPLRAETRLYLEGDGNNIRFFFKSRGSSRSAEVEVYNFFHSSLSSVPQISKLHLCGDESRKLVFRHRWPRPWFRTGWSRSNFASRERSSLLAGVTAPLSRKRDSAGRG